SGDQGSARIRFDPAGTDLALGQARLSHPRRHPDHAAGRGAEDRVSDDRSLHVIASAAKQSIALPRERMDCFVALLLATTPIDFVAPKAPRPSAAAVLRRTIPRPGG